MDDLVQRLANFSPQKRQLLMQWLHHDRAAHSTVGSDHTAATDRQAAVAARVTTTVPLMPTQRWFFEEQIAVDVHHWNTVVLFEVWQPLDPALLQQALRTIMVHHDALQLRFERDTTGWRQSILAHDEPSFISVDLSALPEAEQRPAVETLLAALHTTLNISDGPLMQTALINLGPLQPGRLGIIIHHLIIDIISWRIVLEDLQTAYQQLSRGQAVVLPPKTTSFKQWAERLADYAQSDALRQELTYWLALPWRQVPALPIDDPDGINCEGAFSTIRRTLSVEETRALLDVTGANGIQMTDVLVTAVMRAFAKWTGARTLLLETVGHGRAEQLFDDVDLSRTVGWLVAHTPLVLTLGTATTPIEEIRLIRAQLQRIRHHGFGFGILRYLTNDPAVQAPLRALPQPQMFLNYLGQFRQQAAANTALRTANESLGPRTSSKNVRVHLLSWEIMIDNDQLHVALDYCENINRRATAEGLVGDFTAALVLLTTAIAQAQSEAA